MTVQFDRSLNKERPQSEDALASSASGNPAYPAKSRNSSLKWFYDLPVERKQFLGSFVSEFLAVLGIIGVGSWLIVSGGRAQLREQAKSELAASQANYNIKINQMGFGFRGQSDNAAIIEAARSATQGEEIDPEVGDRVRNILKNEIQARNIEYATLVGKDLKIIASANANRVGQTFNPNDLVSKVLADPEQLKATAIVPWEDLKKESSPLPEGFADSDALIRYTATPVTPLGSQTVLGVLVSGDIVNGKLPIAEKTLNEFNAGYSGVYQYSDEEFLLATSLERDARQQEDRANAEINDLSLLEAAIANPEEVITQRVRQGYRTYTTAAMALTDINDKPVGVLVRGTPETALNQLLGNSLQLQLLHRSDRPQLHPVEAAGGNHLQTRRRPPKNYR